jgi:hypothetical protein
MPGLVVGELDLAMRGGPVHGATVAGRARIR